MQSIAQKESFFEEVFSRSGGNAKSAIASGPGGLVYAGITLEVAVRRTIRLLRPTTKDRVEALIRRNPELFSNDEGCEFPHRPGRRFEKRK